MIGRSGSSAGSWVAASQSLRIGRWRAAGLVEDCIGAGSPIERRRQVCDAGAPNATILMNAISDLRQYALAEGTHLGDDIVGRGPLEIEIDRGDAELAQGMNIGDEIGIVAGKQPAIAVRRNGG